METELKFKFAPGGSAQVERVLSTLQEAVPAGDRREVTTYFDTADRALLNAGWTLRVRLSGERRVQTLKSIAVAGTAFARYEKEWPVRGERPDPHRLAATPAAAAIPDGIRLEAVFTTDILRRGYQVALEGGEAELVLDEGEIRAGTAAEPVHELEIELKSGAVAALYGFAERLHGEVPLRITTDSKAARGYRLGGERPATAQEEEDIRLATDATLEDGLRAVIGNGVGQLLANLPALGLSDDPEPLHQMRVAIRRLRSALILFEPCLESEATARFESELQRFGRILGDCRDWDVFISETLPHVQEEGLDAAWLTLLAPPAEGARRDARRAVHRLVESPEFTGFVLALSGWIDGALWQPPGKSGEKLPATPLKDLAPEILDRLEAKVQKRGRHIASASPEELHSLRKMLKKLRYSCEYLADIYPEGHSKKYRRTCKEVLDILGAFNDAVAAERMVGTVADRGGARLAPSVGILSRWAAGRRLDAIAQLPKAWQHFEAHRPFWR